MEEHSEELDAIEPMQAVEFAIGDSVVYPHHGAGQVVRKEVKEVLGERREYLTIKILHNDMTVMVPTANAARAGLRRVIDEDTVKKVLAVLQDECSEMPKNWNRRFKHNRDKIKTGDVYELAEVVRNLAIREAEKGLSTGEKQMFTRARKILASELMYALEMTAEQVELHLDSLLLDSSGPATRTVSSNGKVATAEAKLQTASGKPGAGGVATNGKIAATAGGLPSLDGDLALSPE
jgi:CarD family transcriptional regulator